MPSVPRVRKQLEKSGPRGTAIGTSAGAATEMLGGTPDKFGDAVALAQQRILGIACDPDGGAADPTCAFRKATGAAIAMAAVEIAIAGITFPVPVDQVTDLAAEIGDSIDVRNREREVGVLAATATGQRRDRERTIPA